MDARIATTRIKMTPMNQGASLHSPRIPFEDSHLRMEPQVSFKGLHGSPIPKSTFISTQTAEPTKAKNSIQDEIRSIILALYQN